MQQQQQHHGYMHQTSMSSVRSVTSPPHSTTMVGSPQLHFIFHWDALNLSEPKTANCKFAMKFDQRFPTLGGASKISVGCDILAVKRIK